MGPEVTPGPRDRQQGQADGPRAGVTGTAGGSWPRRRDSGQLHGASGAALRARAVPGKAASKPPFPGLLVGFDGYRFYARI